MAHHAQKSDLSIFVGGLINSTTNEELFAYFSKFGSIVKCEAQMWKNNPAKCRGFAVLTAGNKTTYDAIMNRQHVIGNRHVECKPLVKDRSQLSSYCREELDKKLYVSGISKKVSDELLRDYFSQFGEVKIAYIVRHHKDNKPKGFGFVSFATKEAKEAVLNKDIHMLLGKQVFCTEYSTKADLKKGAKSKSSQEREEDFYHTSDNNSDQETQENHITQIEQTSLVSECIETPVYFESSVDKGLYAQGWQEGCQTAIASPRADARSQYCAGNFVAWQDNLTQHAISPVVSTQPSLYSPFKGSNGLMVKMSSWRQSPLYTYSACY